MIEYILIGSSFAFAAAVQPGPLQAYLLSSVLQKGWKKTLPASFSPLISDIPIALLVLFLLKNISPLVSKVLQGAGGILLLYLAWSGYRQLKKKKEGSKKENDSAPATLFKAVSVNILNPNPYLGWSLVMGPLFLKAWAVAPVNSIILVVSFYTTMIVVLAGTIVLFGTTSLLTGKKKEKLLLASVLLLGLIGVYQLVMSVI